MNSQPTSNEKIAEALRLLDEAAKERKDEIGNLISEKYANLKDAVADTEQALAAVRRRAVEAALHARDVATEKAKRIAGEVDGHVRENPWPYIGGAALVAFLAGFVLARKRD